MAKTVVLRNLHCFATEDSGEDELYMVNSIRGRFWPPMGVFSMRGGQDAPMHEVLHMPGDSMTIELFDEDDIDEDDNLGRATIRASDEGQGPLLHASATGGTSLVAIRLSGGPLVGVLPRVSLPSRRPIAHTAAEEVPRN